MSSRATRHTGSGPAVLATSDHEQLTLARFLPYRLNVAAAAVSEGLSRTYGERFGIGIPEWRVLATVGEFGTLTATAVGQHSRMGKVKVSRAVAALEARGFLLRSADERDGRQALLRLTAAGEATYHEVAGLARDYVGRLTLALTPREAAILDDLLDRLVRRAAEMGTSA